MSTTTSKLALTKPDYRDTRWDLPLNANLEILDSVHGTVIAVDKILETTANAVTAFVYDASKDSGGGAYRKRCQDLAWYNETLNTSTRGATRKIPVTTLLVAETTLVTLYDLTDPSVPMWRVHDFTSYIVTAVKMLNSKLVVSTTVGLYTFDYLSEEELWYTTASSLAIVNNACNGVAMTVLSDAPIDQDTDLPIPTKLVSTAAGASWIKDDETIIDATGAINLIAADINSSGLSAMASASTVYVFNTVPASDVALTSADYITGTTATITSIKLAGSDIIIGTSEGTITTKYNVDSPNDSTGYQMTSSFFSGIMQCDIKLATLADSVAGDITSADPVEDRSVNDNPLQVVGTITKAPVATGSELMAYSGFSVTDYIEQLYNSDLDFGTGDFYVMGWLETSQGSGSAEYMFERAKPGSATNYLYIRRTSSSGDLGVGMAGMAAIEVSSILENNVSQFILVYVKSNILYVFVDGVQVASAATTGSMTIVDAIVRLGVRAYSISDPGVYQSLSLWRIGAGYPSDEQILDTYEMEKKLFEENAEYLLPSDNVQTLDFDDYNNTLVVGTDLSTVRFKDLRKIEDSISVNSQTSQDVVSVSSNKGTVGIITVAETGIIIPTLNIREEVSKLEGALNPLIEDYEHMGKFIPTSAITADHTIDIDNDRLLIVAAVTSDIDITLPLLSTLAGRHYQLIEFVPVVANGYRVRIKCQGSDTFPFGNTWFDLPASQKHFAIGLHEHGFNLRRNISISGTYVRATSWAASNFSSAVALPFLVEADNNQSELIEWNSSTRFTLQTSAKYDITGAISIDSTGGSTWNVIVELRKNGTYVDYSRVVTGNYGGEDSSLFMFTDVDLVAGDYVELWISHTNLTGSLLTSKMSIKTRL